MKFNTSIYFRKSKTTVVLVSLLFFGFLFSCVSDSKPANVPIRPNFLLILADDLGYETLKCYGGLDYNTPHLDKLAAEGLRFTRAYTSPVCTPSRMSLYTGTYASRHQYFKVLPVHEGTMEAVDFKNEWPTYAQFLQGAGYTTSVTGKWQLATLEYHPEHIQEAGFDSWCVWQIWREGAKTTRYWEPCFNHDGQIRTDIAHRFGPDVLADYVINQMKTSIENQTPFFIHHNMLLPHWPVIATPDDQGAGKPGSLAGMINYMDGIVGRLVAAVDELGIADNTWIIFMGDNGTEAFGESRHTQHGTVEGGKRDLTDAGTHIPMIVRHPGTVQPGIAEDLIDMADWFPTFCELAQVDRPEDLLLDGTSFASRLLENKPFPRKWVTSGINQKMSVFDGQIRVTTGSEKTVENARLYEILESLRKI